MTSKMWVTLALTLIGLTGCGRTIGQSCKFASDCDGDWCVSSLQETSKVAITPQCLPECTTDAECESGHCVAIGDGVGPASASTSVKHSVCAPQTR